MNTKQKIIILKRQMFLYLLKKLSSVVEVKLIIIYLKKVLFIVNKLIILIVKTYAQRKVKKLNKNNTKKISN